MKQLLKLTTFLLFAQLSQLQAQTSIVQPAGRKTWGLTTSLNPGITVKTPRFVIAADFQLERRLTDLLGLTFRAGFTAVTSKARYVTFTFDPPYPPVTFGYQNDQNFIPLQLGLKLYPSEKLYLAGGAGIAIDINGNSATAWSAAAGTPLGKKFDLGLKYENYEKNFSNSSQIAVRLGYRIF
jgi:hypothetical protein